MPNYDYVQYGQLFDLVIPKPVVDICSKANPGDCSQFQFVESVDSVYDGSSSKPSFSVTTLEDGSWNLTNDLDPKCAETRVKHLYIIVTEQTEKTDEAEVIQELQETQEAPPEEPSHETLIPSGEIAGESTENVEHIEEQEQATYLEVHNLPDDGAGVVDIKPQIDEAEGQEEYAYPTYVQEEEEEEPEHEPEQDPGAATDHDYIVAADELDNMSSEEEMTPSQQETPGTNVRVPERKAVACAICPGQSKDYWNYLKHVKRYHTEHPSYWTIIQELKPLLRVACKLCGKLFSSPKILLEHEQKVHNQSIGAMCNQCGKIFKSEHHLKIHIKYLHLRKPGTFLCDMCPAKFNTSNVLKEHVKYTHSNIDRSNKCTECDFKYAFQKQFYEHFQRVHAPKKHVCPYCEYKCATRWYMKKHVTNCAPKTSQMGGPTAKRQKLEKAKKAQDKATEEQPAVEVNLEVLQQAEQADEASEHTQIVHQEVYQVEESAPNEDLPTASINYEIAEAEIQQGDDAVSTIAAVTAEGKIISEDADGKRTMVSLMGSDGNRQTIEIIIPGE